MRSASRISGRRVATAILSLSVIACSLDTTSPSNGSNPATETYAASLGVTLAQMTKVSSALYTQDLVAGTGAVLANGDSLSVTYSGWLVNGKLFESNVGAASAFATRIGVGHVIPGWDLGLVGMQVGGKRRLVIGSDLAYGASGAGNCAVQVCIPANSTLVFEVQFIAKY